MNNVSDFRKEVSGREVKLNKFFFLSLKKTLNN